MPMIIWWSSVPYFGPIEPSIVQLGNKAAAKINNTAAAIAMLHADGFYIFRKIALHLQIRLT